MQAAADAGALAGVTYLGNVQFTNNDPACSYGSAAANAACTYALTNGLRLAEIQNVVVDNTNLMVTISAQRMVPALFARVLSYSQFQVNVAATAGLQGLTSANGLIPIGLDVQTPYTYGQNIAIHLGDCGNGCWQGLALPDQSGASSGANVFRNNLAHGCDCIVNVGDTAVSEPGATSGPTAQGVGQRVSTGLAVDSGGTWDSHTTNDPRATTVALVNWSGCNGKCTTTVLGFAEVWIVNANGGTINAVFIRQVAFGSGGSNGPPAGAYHATLLR